MSLETNSANEIRANWLELKFKLIIIDLTLFVNRALVYAMSDMLQWNLIYALRCMFSHVACPLPHARVTKVNGNIQHQQRHLVPTNRHTPIKVTSRWAMSLLWRHCVLSGNLNTNVKGRRPPTKCTGHQIKFDYFLPSFVFSRLPLVTTVKICYRRFHCYLFPYWAFDPGLAQFP